MICEAMIRFGAKENLLELSYLRFEGKFSKFNFFNSFDNTLELVKNEAIFYHNTFDKSLKNDYIMIIKELYTLHNFFSSTLTKVML